MQIRFGIFAPPLHEQLDMDKEDLTLIQRLADAVALCSVHFILTDSQSHNARKKIVKKIDEMIEELNADDAEA